MIESHLLCTLSQLASLKKATARKTDNAKMRTAPTKADVTQAMNSLRTVIRERKKRIVGENFAT